MGSQVELHPIIGDFPTGFTHGAMLWTLFVQHRVRIVYVDDDALGFSETKRPLKHAALAPERKMTHIAGRSAAALGLDQLIILPEGAVEKSQVTFINGVLPVFSESGDAGGIEKSLFFVDELEAEARPCRRSRLLLPAKRAEREE
jgi:hypothetical protein